jgi:hypothetical protein
MTAVRFASIVLTRVATAVFCLVTSLYCLLTYSPFAYQQFIRPHLVQGLVPLVVWHHIIYVVVFGATALSMVEELRSGRGRVVGCSYLAASAAIGALLLARPVLPQVENNGRGLVLAFIALLPPIWLAAYDHARTRELVPAAAISESRIVRGALLAALVVWAGQTAAMPLRLEYTGEITLTPAGIGLGMASSLVVHLLVFAFFSLALVAAVRVCPPRWHAIALTAAAAGAGAVVIRQIVFTALSFSGAAAWALAWLLGVMFAMLWSALARRLAQGRDADAMHLSALDLWRVLLPGARSRPASLGALALVGVAAYFVLGAVMTFDWDFVVQKLCVVVLWAVAFGYAYGAFAPRHERLTMVKLVANPLVAIVLFGTTVAAEPRLPRWLGDRTFVPEFVLQGYVAVDPSYRLIRDMLRSPSKADAQFYAFLRSHSNIERDIPPVEIDLVTHPGRSPSPPPDIFLIVIDSLRRDYLSPYNEAVQFTPSIAEFAKDSVVFSNAFTQYGGTGLSMPSLWTGGLVLHKQYITPYHPMSLLAKLLDAERYTKILSPDHITVQMLPPGSPFIELDRGRKEMQYQVCRTMTEMTGVMARQDRQSPLFAHTRALDLHIAHVRRFPIPAGKSYEGFLAPVAAAVEQIDGCFGRFIQDLKTQGRYENSIVILTADHGDSLGERLTWGHALTIYPEVLQIPLIVHVPTELRARYDVDVDAPSFLADLTPSLYELTGHPPRDLGPLFGRSLFVRRGEEASDAVRREVLVGSSYGAVYGVLHGNGGKLYVADGLNEREFAYELDGGRTRRVGVTQEEREVHRSFIRQRVEELARLYHFQPAP